MADARCVHTGGTWRNKDGEMRGSLVFPATPHASIRRHDDPKPLGTIWDCDARKRKITVTFDNGPKHVRVMDGDEKLLFGHGRKDVAQIWTR